MPTAEVASWPYGGANYNDMEGLTFVPAGFVLAGVTAPAGGAFVAVDSNDDFFTMYDAAGTVLSQSLPTPAGNLHGVEFVESGTHAGRLAVIQDMSVQEYLYFVDTARIVDMTGPEEIAHLPNSDKILIVDGGIDTAVVIDTLAIASQAYDTLQFGIDIATAAAIHPQDRAHVVGDHPSHRYVYLPVTDGGGEGVEREADLSAYTSATLSLRYWPKDLDDASDYVTIGISAEGGPNWTELGRIERPGNDPGEVLLTREHDITSFMAPQTRIRFLTSPTMGRTDRVFFDDVEISVSGCAGP